VKTLPFYTNFDHNTLAYADYICSLLTQDQHRYQLSFTTGAAGPTLSMQSTLNSMQSNILAQSTIFLIFVYTEAILNTYNAHSCAMGLCPRPVVKHNTALPQTP